MASPPTRPVVSCPVVSVGNLAMGGRGKTPTVARVAELLLDAGERPAILSRGYLRRAPEDGVVIVSDGRHLRADLDRSGDEPLMLARQVRGAAVLVCDVRAMAAAVAEVALDVSVHVLDDGFQHRSLRRDVDLVLVTPGDLADRRAPLGHLRSPVRALSRAHAVIVDGDDGDAAERLARIVDRGSTAIFRLTRQLGEPRWVDRQDHGRPLPSRGQPVLAVAGIADPPRFQRALERDGWTVAGLAGFGDHHHYTAGDLARVARMAGGLPILTTEKDAVRLGPLRPLPVPVAWVPLRVAIDPEPAFRQWLVDQLAQVRG